MRDYSKVSPTFWTGETGRKIRALQNRDITTLALYALTNPHANMLGLYYLPVPYISHETGIPIEGVSKGLVSLFEVGFCSYDAASEHIFVYEMAKYQIADQLKPEDKRVIGIRKDYENLPKNKFLKDFFNKYQHNFHLINPRDYEAPYKPHRSQEQEQEQEQDIKPLSLANPLCDDVVVGPFPEITELPTWIRDKLNISGIADKNIDHAWPVVACKLREQTIPQSAKTWAAKIITMFVRGHREGWDKLPEEKQNGNQRQSINRNQRVNDELDRIAQEDIEQNGFASTLDH